MYTASSIKGVYSCSLQVQETGRKKTVVPEIKVFFFFLLSFCFWHSNRSFGQLDRVQALLPARFHAYLALHVGIQGGQGSWRSNLVLFVRLYSRASGPLCANGCTAYTPPSLRQTVFWFAMVFEKVQTNFKNTLQENCVFSASFRGRHFSPCGSLPPPASTTNGATS